MDTPSPCPASSDPSASDSPEDLIAWIKYEARLLRGSRPDVRLFQEDSLWVATASVDDGLTWAEYRASVGSKASAVDALRRLLAAVRVPLLACGYVPPAELPAEERAS